VKRRTFKRLRAPGNQTRESVGSGPDGSDHHSVYVVELDPVVSKLRKVRLQNPGRDGRKPCLYVGMTGLPVEERFANHKTGVKAAFLVRRYGLRLLPEMFAHLNPMPYEAAAQMERDLAEDLRSQGFTVMGGH